MLPGIEDRLIDAPGIPDNLWSTDLSRSEGNNFEVQVYDRKFILQGIPDHVLPYLRRMDMGEVFIEPSETITIPIYRSPYPQYNSTEFSGRTYQIKFSFDGDLISFYGYFFAARFSIETLELKVVFADARSQDLANDFENFLRIISSLYLQFQDIYLFHSSAVSVEEDTFVFFGPQDSGKSTMALMAPEGSEVLGDDLNALVLDSGQLFIASVPFPSEVTQIRPVMKKPVTAMFRLIKDTEPSFESLSDARKVATLYGSMPVLNMVPDCLPLLQKGIEAILSVVPVCSLHFPKNKEVYTWLKQNLKKQKEKHATSKSPAQTRRLSTQEKSQSAPWSTTTPESGQR